MSPFVNLPIWTGHKCLAATGEWALVWFLSTVCPHVNLQSRTRWKPSPAPRFFTFVWFSICMHYHVCDQIRLLCKCLTTSWIWAHIWLFPRVSSCMQPECWCISISSPTNCAHHPFVFLIHLTDWKLVFFQRREQIIRYKIFLSEKHPSSLFSDLFRLISGSDPNA